jgi:hypothetical protein
MFWVEDGKQGQKLKREAAAVHSGKRPLRTTAITADSRTVNDPNVMVCTVLGILRDD